MRTRQPFALAALALSFAVAACGSNQKATAPAGDAQPTTAPAPTGEVIEVKMVTDGAGNYFEPAEISAKPGDVVRFTLVSGVHNVSFAAAQDADATGLPEAGPYLQLPGQTHDVVVGMEPGSHAFQCDPHAALGMVGTLTVQ